MEVRLPNKQSSTGVQLLLGFVLGIAVNVVMTLAGFFLALLIFYGRMSPDMRLKGLVLTGAVQLAWQVPLIVLLRRRGYKIVSLGVILACSVSLLLNALCWATANMRVGG